MSYNPSESLDPNNMPEINQLSSVETALENLHEIRAKGSDIFQILIGISKSSNTMNFQRTGLERLTKMKANLEKIEAMFEQTHVAHAECVKTEATFDKSKEPELTFADSPSSNNFPRNTDNFTPRDEQLLRRKMELEAVLDEKREKLKNIMTDIQDVQHLVQSAFPWQSRK